MKHRNRQRAASALCAVTLLGMTGATNCKGRLPNFLSKSDEIPLGQQGSREVEAEGRIVMSGDEYSQSGKLP